MTRDMAWIGFIATLLIGVVMAVYIWREPDQQDQRTLDLRVEAVVEGTDLYAETCAVCHGASGEGLGAVPALNSDAVRSMDYIDLVHTIERGRYNTVMTAYSVDEGGIYTSAQIDSLAAVIQYANWNAIAARVDALGLTPPEPIIVELSEETLQSVRSLPDGDVLAESLQLFATECSACHGGNGEGTNLAPALDSDELRARMTETDLTRTIEQGVPGTLMAAWNRALTTDQIAGLVMLIERWPELWDAGIELPVIAPEPIDMSPEAIARGEWLFSITCARCHGADGYGTPLAPSLNNQTFLSDTPDDAIQQIIAGGVTGTAMPAWGGRLSESDIAALVAYLRSWEPTAPAVATTTTGTAASGTTGSRGGPPWRQN
jgi:mono/diheme cytochrome c family protein